MRVRVYETSDRFKEFASMTIACKALGYTNPKKLQKEKKVERVYQRGYWADVPEDWLKLIGYRRKYRDAEYAFID